MVGVLEVGFKAHFWLGIREGLLWSPLSLVGLVLSPVVVITHVPQCCVLPLLGWSRIECCLFLGSPCWGVFPPFGVPSSVVYVLPLFILHLTCLARLLVAQGFVSKVNQGAY